MEHVKYGRVLIRARMPYAIFFLMSEKSSMYFKLKSREIPRKGAQGLSTSQKSTKEKMLNIFDALKILQI